MKILVTGATGNLGSKIVESLVEQVPVSNIVVSVRDRHSEKAQAYAAQGMDVREGDFEQPESLEAVFAGVDRAFIISTFGDFETIMRQHTNAVEAAKAAGVQQVVYSSVTRADSSDFFLAGMHRAREEAILNSGIPFVFLRNNWYVENELATIQGCIAGAPWLTAAGVGKIGWAYRPDLAEAAANVLASTGHDNKMYELAGENLTQKQFVDVLSEVLGKEVPFLAVDDAAFGEMMRGAGVPEAYMPMLEMTQKGVREGGLEVESKDLETLLGRPATTLKEALEKLLK